MVVVKVLPGSERDGCAQQAAQEDSPKSTRVQRIAHSGQFGWSTSTTQLSESSKRAATPDRGAWAAASAARLEAAKEKDMELYGEDGRVRVYGDRLRRGPTLERTHTVDDSTKIAALSTRHAVDEQCPPVCTVRQARVEMALSFISVGLDVCGCEACRVRGVLGDGWPGGLVGAPAFRLCRGLSWSPATTPLRHYALLSLVGTAASK